MKWKTVLGCGLGLCLLPAVALAASGAANEIKRSDPIHVIADHLEVNNSLQLANFIGSVKAVQGDVTIVCDRMEVYYESKNKQDTENGEAPPNAIMDNGGSIRTVVALGHVKITQGDRVAVGRKATYWAGSRKILLEGQATLWRGPNQVSGEQVTVYLDENQSIVESRPGRRVSVTIFPEDNRELLK
jgi:lipopolysaccharide export system protein LptA